MGMTSHSIATETTAVSLYNLGLSYHRSGFESGKSLFFVCKTLGLYIKTFEVLGPDGKTDSQALIVFVMVFCHNMACVFFFFCEANTIAA
jgi:hypothetical protein